MKHNTESPLSILAYTDGTDNSIDAVRSGIRLAAKTGGSIDILHATSLPVETEIEETTPAVGEPIPRKDWIGLPDGLRHLTLDVISWLAAEKVCAIPDDIQIRHQGLTLRRIVLDSGKTPVRLWLSYASPSDALSALVNENKIDLVIVRGEEASLLNRLLGKNLAEAMALNLPTNILVIRGAIYSDTRFVIASDGSESSNRAFGILRKIIPAIKKPIGILAKEGADTQDLETWLEAHKRKGKVEILKDIEGESETSPLNNIVDKLPPDRVLVLGASMRNSILRAFKGSLPLALVRAAPFSVLISKELPDKADQEVKK